MNTILQLLALIQLTSSFVTIIFRKNAYSVPSSLDMTKTSDLKMPLTLDAMIQEASDTIRNASEKGKKRQIVRILLPRDSKSGQLGQYIENKVDDESNVVLVPPDESWQGGIMQLYRSCFPTCQDMIRQLIEDVAGVPPRIIEDRTVDESGVDGVCLLRDSSNDIFCFVQPLQETVPKIIKKCNDIGDNKLMILVNPQWRDVDDAFDSASRNDGLIGALASFLGGKGSSIKKLEEEGFDMSFCLEGYVCKGGNVRLFKKFDSNWIVYAETDDETDYIRIGQSSERPSYQDVDKMLDDQGISLKYARDIGLAPKFGVNKLE